MVVIYLLVVVVINNVGADTLGGGWFNLEYVSLYLVKLNFKLCTNGGRIDSHKI